MSSQVTKNRKDQKFDELVTEVNLLLHKHRMQVFDRTKPIFLAAIVEADRRDNTLAVLLEECTCKTKSDAWHIVNCALNGGIEEVDDRRISSPDSAAKEYSQSVSRLMGRVLTVGEAIVEPARVKALKSLLTQAVWRNYEPTIEKIQAVLSA